jgi:hypothetical protein
MGSLRFLEKRKGGGFYASWLKNNRFLTKTGRFKNPDCAIREARHDLQLPAHCQSNQSVMLYPILENSVDPCLPAIATGLERIKNVRINTQRHRNLAAANGTAAALELTKLLNSQRLIVWITQGCRRDCRILFVRRHHKDSP